MSAEEARFKAVVKGMDSVDLPGMDDEPDDPANCRIETSLGLGRWARTLGTVSRSSS